MRLAILAAALALSLAPAGATDQGQYGSVPDNIRSWFKSIMSPKGVPCCDVADGRRTTWRAKGAGIEAQVDGEWVDVPEEAIVYNAGNPTGEPVIWITKYSGTVHVRCFVYAGGV